MARSLVRLIPVAIIVGLALGSMLAFYFGFVLAPVAAIALFVVGFVIVDRITAARRRRRKEAAGTPPPPQPLPPARLRIADQPRKPGNG